MFDQLKAWLTLATDRRGVTALEYAMMAGIVVAVIAVGFGVFASDITAQFSSLGGNL